jgi:phenylpropionate dioxygenase-like ring-hydroxylating dioxygenase large terminal subunit
MFINFWYCAATSDEVSDSPLKVRMLGQNFVLFRDSSGVVHCLHDVCSHRGASLAEGKLHEDCIQCPYHGWRYDGSGACRHIPTLEEGARIPARARVDSYPTAEQSGLVFAFLGDLPEAERPSIMDVAEWGNEGWSGVEQHWELAYPYVRAVENAMDVFHNDFVHPEFMVPDAHQGKRAVPLFDFKETEWDTTFTTRLPSNDLDDSVIPTIEGDTISQVETGHIGVSCYFSHVQISATQKLCLHFFATPIDTLHTRLFLVTTRNFMAGKEHDEEILRANEHTVMQDVRVVGGIRPLTTPSSNVTELLIAEDRGVAAYRKRRKEWTEKRWRIDVDALAADGGRSAFAVPSPGRRESGNWVINPVPLVS